MPTIGQTHPIPPHLILFGPSGVGKTVLSTTLGKGTLLCDFDRGWTSALLVKDGLSSARHQVEIGGPVVDGQPIGYHDLPTTKPSGFLTFKSHILAISDSIHAGKQTQVKAVVVDSLSSLFAGAMRSVLYNSGKDWSKCDPSALKSFVEMQHWGLAFNDVENILTILKSLPIVVVVIAHDQRDKRPNFTSTGKQEDREIIELGIPGKNMPSKISAMFDEVWYMKVVQREGGKVARVLQTQPDDVVCPKTRLGVKNFTDADPGLPSIFLTIGFDWQAFREGKVVSK